MPPPVKRSYQSPVRAARARDTRRRVRQAATRLFVEQGYGRTTIRDIAETAGVAPRTVHLAYPGGKLEIFRDSLDVAVAGDELPLSQSDRMQESGMLDRPRDVVHALVDQTASLLSRAGALIMTTVTSAGADPDMARLSAEGAAATRANVRAVASSLAEAGMLRAGTDVDRAADVLLVLCSPHAHSLLCDERGWGVDEYRAWLEDAVRRTLLEEPGRSSAGSHPGPSRDHQPRSGRPPRK